MTARGEDQSELEAMASDWCDRIVARAEPEPNTGCWLWTGPVNHEGYGIASFGNRTKIVHRVAFRLWRGEIAAGLVLDHLCRVRCCVNPFHLEPVTQRTNVLRADSLPAANLEKTTCPKGHPLDGVYMTGRRSGWRYCKVCYRAWSARAKHRRADA